MAEPLTLGILGATVLTQGISFLYGQATELLKHRREHKDLAAADSGEVVFATSPDNGLLLGELRPTKIDDATVEQHREKMAVLLERLSSYVSGIRVVDPANGELVAQVEALRGLLELVYRQRITFRGERREPTGASVDVRVVAEQVNGNLTVARIGTVSGHADVRAVGEIGTVGERASITGFEADSVG
jgi:hypothetical protein